MKIILRTVVCFVAVVGFSVATAWAWDRSERLQTTTVQAH